MDQFQRPVRNQGKLPTRILISNPGTKSNRMETHLPWQVGDTSSMAGGQPIGVNCRMIIWRTLFSQDFSLLATNGWSAWRDLWQQRNQAILGHDSNTCELLALRTQALQRLQDLYSRKGEIEPSVQDQMFDQYAKHFGKSTNAIVKWLSIHEQGAIQSIKRVQQRAIAGFNLFANTSTQHGTQKSYPAITRPPPKRSIIDTRSMRREQGRNHLTPHTLSDQGGPSIQTYKN